MDCPKTFTEAHEWEDSSNGERKEWEGPLWKFDCGYKLDYDGPLISIESRFFPPKTHYGGTWDGGLSVNLLGEEILKKKFDCPTLPALKKEVEEYIETLQAMLSSFNT